MKHFLPQSIFPNQAVNLIAEKSAWVPWFKKGGGIGVLGTFGEVFGFQERFVYCIYRRIYIYMYIYMYICIYICIYIYVYDETHAKKRDPKSSTHLFRVPKSVS